MFLFDEQYLVCRGESISSLSNISINKKPVFVSYVVIYENYCLGWKKLFILVCNLEVYIFTTAYTAVIS